MGTVETLAIVGAILSGFFFIGALIWAVRSFSRKKTHDVPRHIYHDNTNYPGQSGTHPAQVQNAQSQWTGDTKSHQPSEEPVEYSRYGSEEELFPEQESYGSFFEEENIIPKKGKGYPAASKESDMSEEDFYKIEGYDFGADLHGADGEMEWESDKKNLPSVISADGKMPKIEKRDRAQKRILDESVRCNICLGYIKTGLPLITCVCGKNYHISCGSRVEECPICHNDMLEYEDLLLEAKKAGETDDDVREPSSSEEEPEHAGSDDHDDDNDDEEIAGMSGDTMEKSMNILEKEQMERLKKLLKKYNLDNDISDRASLKVLRKK